MRRASLALAILLAALPAAARDTYWSSPPDTSRLAMPKEYPAPRNQMALDRLNQMDYGRIARPQMLEEPVLQNGADRIRSARPIMDKLVDDRSFPDRLSRGKAVDSTPRSYDVSSRRIGVPRLSASIDPYGASGFRTSRLQRVDPSGLAAVGIGAEDPAKTPLPSVGAVVDPSYSPNSVRSRHDFVSLDREMARKPLDLPARQRDWQFTGTTTDQRGAPNDYRALQRRGRVEGLRGAQYQGGGYLPTEAAAPRPRQPALPKGDRSNAQAAYDGAATDTPLFGKAPAIRREKPPVAPLFVVR